MQHKKQMFSLLEGIADINNNVWGNPKHSYDDATEAAYQIEEALEGFEDGMQVLAFNLGLDKKYPADADEVCHAKHLARHIVTVVKEGCEIEPDVIPVIADVDRFDKALDAIYFAVGSLHKLGLDPSQMVDGLQIVHNANLQKTGSKDAEGKVGKPDDFIAPEPLLQAILDKRSK